MIRPEQYLTDKEIKRVYQQVKCHDQYVFITDYMPVLKGHAHAKIF